MNTEKIKGKKTHSPLTGRRYRSVDEFLAGESVSPEVRGAVSKMDEDINVVNALIKARKEAGMTQQQMADKLGKTQSAISKLESSIDAEITLAEVLEYAQATEETFSMFIGRSLNHIEAVKYHAFALKEHLSALAKEAHRNEEAEQAVQGFFGEAFFNILNILSRCHGEMPNGGGVGVRMKKIARTTATREEPTVTA